MSHLLKEEEKLYQLSQDKYCALMWKRNGDSRSNSTYSRQLKKFLKSETSAKGKTAWPRKAFQSQVNRLCKYLNKNHPDRQVTMLANAFYAEVRKRTKQIPLPELVSLAAHQLELFDHLHREFLLDGGFDDKDAVDLWRKCILTLKLENAAAMRVCEANSRTLSSSDGSNSVATPSPSNPRNKMDIHFLCIPVR
jgi:hypothetical protein